MNMMINHTVAHQLMPHNHSTHYRQSGSSLDLEHSSIKPLPSIEPSGATEQTTSADNLFSSSSSRDTKQALEALETLEQKVIRELAARDREVRNHEQAHAAVGGIYAGAPRYHYEKGPDGVNYAVAGEVSIDTSPVNGDPQMTIEKAKIIQRAAMAPAEPSAQDRKVAAEASKLELDARIELMEENIQSEKSTMSDKDQKASIAATTTSTKNPLTVDPVEMMNQTQEAIFSELNHNLDEQPIPADKLFVFSKPLGNNINQSV